MPLCDDRDPTIQTTRPL